MNWTRTTWTICLRRIVEEDADEEDDVDEAEDMEPIDPADLSDLPGESEGEDTEADEEEHPL